MQQSGYILRFVDVVLILLFGFISIATIKKSQVKLPESTETPKMEMDTAVTLYVSVLPDGTYLVEEETRAINSRSGLRDYLRRQKRRLGVGAPVKVRLRASRDAPMRHLMASAKICDELGLKKAIDVKIEGVQ